MKFLSRKVALRKLMAAVIEQCFDDLRGVGLATCKDTDRAMDYILSEKCAAFCFELGIDHKTICSKAAELYRVFLGKTDSYEFVTNKLSGNPAEGEDMMNNPFRKKYFNLTEQMLVEKNDPAMAERLRKMAAEQNAQDRRKEHTRSLAEFNEMDKDGKINFIRNGGEVTWGPGE